MRKTGFWKTDWFLGLALSGALLIAANIAFFIAPQAVGVVSEAGLVLLPNRLLQPSSTVSSIYSLWTARGAYVLVTLYLMAALPRFSTGVGAIASAIILLVSIGVQVLLMRASSPGISLLPSMALLLAGYLLLSARQGKESSGAGSSAGPRILGIAFQGQGHLDLAFEKFRQCTPDDALMENLYSLGLDFERKEKFDKAAEVFRYMASLDTTYRDIAQRMGRTERVPESVSHAAAPPAKRTIGRYQIEKELGKGAMGKVYLARDPKNNREVAIKTMALALAQEFDANELTEVRQRFFREAETAGRLIHPNIVTMYDAGEESGLAYIAMEFLRGSDLVPYTKPDHLLPLPQVVSIVARVADALAYAHGNNVVHRDVKPANVMYDPALDQVKVMDFGIARLTDVSRTKTGMVLGTPSHMSPEQLTGKKVDGRSDLFSLGVTLYQMACGRLPFIGDSMAQLMRKIASEPCPDVRLLNPQVPEALAAVIDRALRKDKAHRYASGNDMASDLRACLGPESARQPQAHVLL